MSVVPGIDRLDGSLFAITSILSLVTFILWSVGMARTRAWASWYHTIVSETLPSWYFLVPNVKWAHGYMLAVSAALTAFQVLARTLILTAFTASFPVPGPIPGVSAVWEITTTEYPDAEASGIASGMVAFFLLSSLCSILFSTFFFSYRWNLAALAMLIVDMYSHVVTAIYATGPYTGGASTIYVVYAIVYLACELLVLLPLTVAALYADSMTGAHLTPSVTHPHIYEIDYRYRMGTGMIFKASGFGVVGVFAAMAFLITLGSQNGWGPITFVVFGGAITMVPFLAIAIATGIALSAEDSDLLAAITEGSGVASQTYIGRYALTGGLLESAPAPEPEKNSFDKPSTDGSSDGGVDDEVGESIGGGQKCAVPRHKRIITNRPMPMGHRVSSGIYSHIA
jgi:hypothetical protein